MKGICSEAAQSRFLLNFNWDLIEIYRKLPWGNLEQIRIDFQLNSNWKLKETAETAQGRF